MDTDKTFQRFKFHAVQCFLSLHGALPLAKKTRHFYWKVNDFKMIQNYAYYSEREEFIVNDYFVLLFR